eukprot:7199854-Prymnesium_polylepis.1
MWREQRYSGTDTARPETDSPSRAFEHHAVPTQMVGARGVRSVKQPVCFFFVGLHVGEGR